MGSEKLRPKKVPGSDPPLANMRLRDWYRGHWR